MVKIGFVYIKMAKSKAFISFSIKGFFKQERESFFSTQAACTQYTLEYSHYRMIRFHSNDEITTPALFRRMQLSNYVMQLLTAFWRPVFKNSTTKKETMNLNTLTYTS